jgi:hypothetical protein
VARRKQSQHLRRPRSQNKTTTIRLRKPHQRTRKRPILQHLRRNSRPSVHGAPTSPRSRTATRAPPRSLRRSKRPVPKRRRSRAKRIPRSGRPICPQAKASRATSRTCRFLTRRPPSAHSSRATTAIPIRATPSSYTTSPRRPLGLGQLLVSLT